jgi:hypothetical protein
MATKAIAVDHERYPPLYLEALAYHEAGHAFMAVLLGLPIDRVAIGPACDDPEFNGRVFLDAEPDAKLPMYQAGLLEVASEPSEKLAPNFARFASMHKTHRHLKPFRLGVRNDLVRGFNAVAPVYILLGFARSTAKQRFKEEYRDTAAELININCDAVCRLALHIRRNLLVDGAAAAAVLLRRGRLRHGGVFDRKSFPEPEGARE